MRHLRKSEINPMKRALAAVLSVLVLFLSMPVGPVVLAATIAHPTGVTVTVTDGTDPIDGAQISGTITSDTAGSGSPVSATTDTNGEAVIFTEVSLSQTDYVVSGTVTKEGYQDAALSAFITAADQDIRVTMTRKTISGVTVTANTLSYTGEPQDTVTVTGTEDGDVITYEINGGLPSEDCKVTDQGTYTVKVTVSRVGFADYVETVSVTVSAQSLGISISPITGLTYIGSEQALVTLTGSFGDRDSVEWWLNDARTGNKDIPAALPVGEYRVRLKVTRMQENNSDPDTNYEAYDSGEVSVTISPALLDLSGLTVTPNSRTYDGQEYPAFSVAPESPSGYTVQYSTAQDGTYSPLPAPKITNAGTYTYWIKAVSTDTDHADSDPVAYTVTIAQKGQDMTVTINGAAYSQDGSDELTLQVADDLPWESGEINPLPILAETGESKAPSAAFSYTVNDASLATVDQSDPDKPKLVILMPGSIEVKITLSGDDNYESKALTYTLKVKAELPEDVSEKFVEFQEEDGLGGKQKVASAVEYTLGTKSGVASELPATVLYSDAATPDIGSVTYTLHQVLEGDPLEEVDFAEVDSNGKVTVSDDAENLPKVLQALEENQGKIRLRVTAEKAETDYYGADKTSYEILIQLADSGDLPVLAFTPDRPDGSNGWYKSAVALALENLVDENDETTVLADADDFEIGYLAPEETALTFAAQARVEDQGEDARKIYLRKKDTGAICQEEFAVKIDTVAPTNVGISYPDDGTLLHDLTFGFYNPSVTITFTAEDATSGPDYVAWEYIPQENQSSINREAASGQVSFANGKAELVLPLSVAEQYRGNIAFTVYDKAGNAAQRQSDGRIVVVDTISPELGEITYTASVNTVDGVEYYNAPGKIQVTLPLTEANFFSEDVVVKLTKDGRESDIAVSWNDQGNDAYTGTFTISGDGRYSFTVSYTDRAGNGPVTYSSGLLVIDTTAPILSSSFDQANQSISFSMTENYFPEGDFTVTASASTITGSAVSTGDVVAFLSNKNNWQGTSGTYSCSMSDLPDGIYNISIGYKDYALNEGSVTTDQFIIDHTAPTDTQITYSTPLLQTALNAVTFGFYNPSVEVTFTAVDQTSGVAQFTWSYTRQDGASETNTAEYPDATVEAVQDSNDRSRFTATVTLPASQAEQIRGSVAVTATDVYGNAGDKVTDNGNVIVVDTIAPTMTVEYSEASRIVDTASYYGMDKNGRIDVTFTVTEANFFSDDVLVSIAKNGAAAERITPAWTDSNADVHVGRYTITGDGHYIVSVTYTDRSNNTMSSYTSNTLTIDTVTPVISVAYQNTNAVNTLADSSGNQRQYYNAVQTAVVTVEEHNFDESEVEFTISGTDVSGSTLSVEGLTSRSAWSHTGDTHRMTITYSGDANYNFDVAYTDLATNEAADYAEDHFTVDLTNPAELSVSYSTSVLDTILENLTFGFYNAPVTVTLTAADATSGIYSFEYSYTVAGGVSGVNSSLSGQTIPMESITFGDGGRSATATFTIPNGTLGPNNQFNGNVDFSARDRANNQSELTETRRVVVDTIAPTIDVVYREEVNSDGAIRYFDAPIEASITVNEANFYADDVTVAVTKDGAGYPVTIAWTDGSTDVHNGAFTLSEDGNYFVNITYRDKSNNTMEEYTSDQLTLDTVLTAPSFDFNSGTAYKGKVTPGLRFYDENFDHFELTLTRVKTYKNDNVVEMSGTADSFDSKTEKTHTFTFDEGAQDQEKREIVTEYTVFLSEENGQYMVAFEDFDEKMQEYDGIYTLSMLLYDKAGHSEPTDHGATSAMFTVNRFGSVYVYNDYLSSLVRNGGAYVQSVEEDLVITEYNADKLVEENIGITKDGKPVEDVDYSSTPTVSDQVTVGDSGWYQYEYTVKNGNFASDGVYKMSISSEDETGNRPENTNYEDMDILFRVDSTPPEITGISGLEESIINAQEVKVRYTVFDAIGLKSVTPEVDGAVDGTMVTEFSEDLNNYTGTFTLKEAGAAQRVRLLVEDLAGNVTDTDSDDFSSAYPFEKAVTVSTNALVRWYANKPLFWGSIGGSVGVAAAGTGGIVALRRRRRAR